MKIIYPLIIGGLLGFMSFEFYIFREHYEGLDQELEIIKQVCKVQIE